MAVMINESTLADVWKDIAAELDRAEALHPNYPSSTESVRRVGIIVEEVGEAMAEALQLSRVGNTEMDEIKRGRPAEIADLYHELLHVAAMAIRNLKAIKQEV